MERGRQAMAPMMQHISLMSCYRMKRDASKLREQLRSLRALRCNGLQAGVIAAHKPTFDLMLAEVFRLQERLERQISDVSGFTAIAAESRRFVETAREVLEDTGSLIELLVWLGAD